MNDWLTLRPTQIWKLLWGPVWGLTSTTKPPAVLYLVLLGSTFAPPPPPPSRIISHRYASARETSRWKHFCFFVVLINFQLSVKHFSVLPCYFMKREDKLEKRWILKLTLNFRGDPTDTASTFLKMTSDFDAVITITDCQIW